MNCPNARHMTSDIISDKNPLRIGAFFVGTTDEQIAIHLGQNTVDDDSDHLPQPFIVRKRFLRDFFEDYNCSSVFCALAPVLHRCTS